MATSTSAARTPPLDWWARRQSLMHDQCWCWGRDVTRPSGNLLTLYGFERVPAPARHTFAYQLTEPARYVLLAGGGMCYGHAPTGSAILLGRYELRPRLLSLAGDEAARWATVGATAFSTEGTPSDAPQTLHLLAAAIDWIVSYEGWVRELAGPEYRRQCLDRWPHGCTPNGNLERAWGELRLELPLSEEGLDR